MNYSGGGGKPLLIGCEVKKISINKNVIQSKPYKDRLYAFLSLNKINGGYFRFLLSILMQLLTRVIYHNKSIQSQL